MSREELDKFIKIDKFIEVTEDTMPWYMSCYQNINSWCFNIINKYKEIHTEDIDYIQDLKFKYFYFDNDNIRIVCEKYIKDLIPNCSEEIHLLIPIDYVCSPFIDCLDSIIVETK